MFNQLPDWTKPTYPPSLLNLFERIALCDLEGQWIRLDAKTQRETIGFPVFGKQEIKVEDGEITIRRSACFGQDSEFQTYPVRILNAAINAGLKLSPGVFGKRYY